MEPWDETEMKFSIKCLIAHLLAKTIFESWVKLLGPPLAISKNFEKILGSQVGYVHGTQYRKTRIEICKGSLG